MKIERLSMARVEKSLGIQNLASVHHIPSGWESASSGREFIPSISDQ